MNDGRLRPPFPFALLRFWTRQTLPAWCLIAGMIFVFQIAVCGTMHDNERVRALLSLLEMLPSFIKGMFGGDILQPGNTSALIAIGYQHPLVLVLFMVYAVGVPTGLLTGEVQRGTMELLLSRPATKTQVYVCAALPTVVGMFALTLVMFAGTVAGTRLFDFGMPIPLMSFFRTAATGGLMASAVGGVALLAAASFRRRSTAVGLTVAFLVLNHFVFVFAGWWPLLDSLRNVSLFAFVDGVRIFREHAWPLDDMGVLLALLLVAGVAGGIIWQKRDLPL
ncbi:MAG: hypothetical protein A3K19_27210 [Lentisphaerae bacterium RIFOXYB12_FULL_65_16]|nr:MAG: hypothetical protein A3K18_16065 [Lentisphaerae bacterium RIFOXYA12_64_32]OGV86379.1 MAG: hypothetical protein A3K19_27210 [Lentisphaerae bacterium RIFOXYB12_FULL_65_16]